MKSDQQSQVNTQRSSTPTYQPKQKVWLFTRDICLQSPLIRLPLRHAETVKPSHIPVMSPPAYAVIILDSCRWSHHLKYWVDWEEYGLAEQSWDPQMTSSIWLFFHAEHPNSPAPGQG
ncbi:Werner syndrome ATP-dependent helicase-like protein [Labeo rohita]|uniref:Werner syndrome ATP-dependent helicase-like protein n=1 Tax=Labeo rohita TaxID=84645 RepID=A0A498MYV6_LABRO|nr:Werner syndrome ATP-dependent helicase-like protein [Labeo rohita]